MKPTKTCTTTGVGHVTYVRGVSSWILAAPSDAQRSYNVDTPIVHIAILSRSHRGWGYGFHEACWKILLARLSPVEDPLRVGEILFDLLATVEHLFTALLDFKHRYTKKLLGCNFTPEVFWGPLWRKGHREYNRDPRVPLSLEQSSLNEQTQQPIIGCVDIFESKRTDSIFTKLSLEIRHAILSHLSLKQIARTRRVCWDFA